MIEKIEAVVCMVYGTERIYPKDKLQAQALEQLTGNKSLTRSAIDALRKLGFNVNIINPYAEINR